MLFLCTFMFSLYIKMSFVVYLNTVKEIIANVVYIVCSAPHNGGYKGINRCMLILVQRLFASLSEIVSPLYFMCQTEVCLAKVKVTY
jgi:hypothetical protein